MNLSYVRGALVAFCWEKIVFGRSGYLRKKENAWTRYQKFNSANSEIAPNVRLHCSRRATQCGIMANDQHFKFPRKFVQINLFESKFLFLWNYCRRKAIANEISQLFALKLKKKHSVLSRTNNCRSGIAVVVLISLAGISWCRHSLFIFASFFRLASALAWL